MSAFLCAQWDEMAWALGIRLDHAARDALFARYREPHRAYHDLAHVEACLRHLEELRGLATRWGEVACALFFHDAIYVPGRAGDEARSAELAGEVLTRGGADPGAIARIERAIRATAGHAPDDDPDVGPDVALVLDLDLAILAAPRDTFDRYEDAIRREWGHVDDDAFARGRAAFAASLLARPAIYARDETRALWEERARENLATSIARWSP